MCKNETFFFLDTWLCFCCWVTTKIYHHDIKFNFPKIIYYTKSNFVSKKKFWYCTKSSESGVNKSKLTLLHEKVFRVNKKKSMLHKKVFYVDKIRSCFTKKYLVLQKVINFFRKAAPYELIMQQIISGYTSIKRFTNSCLKCGNFCKRGE